MHFVSGKWYDESWWEVDVPAPWKITETSTQHIRLSSAEAIALVGFRKHHRLAEGSRRYAEAQGLPPDQEAAYTSAKAESSMSWWPLPIPAPSFIGSVQRTEVAHFIGWTYTTGGGWGKKRWAGYFVQEPWALYIRLESPTIELETNMASLRAVLTAVRFGQ